MTTSLVPTGDIAHPEFTTERLRLDAERATDVIQDRIGGLSSTRTDEGVKFRTMDGMLVAILTGADDESAVDFHYRTAPASEAATLKARKLRRGLEPYVG